MKNNKLRTVFLFFTCFFILLSAGRLSSGDAGTQLQATLLLVKTGSLGSRTPPTGTEGDHPLWVSSANGVYFQCHDVGNIILMFPAAWISSRLSHEPASTQIQTPSIVARLGVALTYAFYCAIGCTFMYATFSLFHSPRRSFILGLIFALATYYVVYAKSAWDVTGACVGVCMLLYSTGRILTKETIEEWDFIKLSASIVFASAFRYSLLPFLVLSLILIGYSLRGKMKIRYFVTAGLTLIIGLIPTFLYNYIRMGSPFLPATVAKQFDYMNALTGNIIVGTLGLLFSPNKGLFIFMPIFVLLFWLPSLWKRLPITQRQIIFCLGSASVLYILLIGKIARWGTFGWGPRYLLPIIPILFFALSAVLTYSERRFKPVIAGLIVLSVLINAPAILTSWRWSSISEPRNLSMNAARPYQIGAAWRGMLQMAAGNPLPAPESVLRDPVRSESTHLPDFWLVYLMAHSKKTAFLGLLITIMLIVPCAVSFRSILRIHPYKE